MHSFDKKISKKLSDAPSALPDQEVWRHVEQRLVSSNRFGRYWKKVATTALLISLLAIGSFLVGRYSAPNAAIQEVDHLEKLPIKQTNKTVVLERQQIIVRDTVVQYVYLDRSNENKMPTKHAYLALAGPLGRSTHLTKSPFQENLTLNSLATHAAPWMPSYSLDVFPPSAFRSGLGIPKLAHRTPRNTLSDKTQTEHESVDLISTHFISNIQSLSRTGAPHITFASIHTLDIQNIIRIEKRDRIFQKLWPDRVSVGLETGAFHPVIEETSDAQEFMFGVHTSLHFSTNFSLITGLRNRTLSINHEDDIDEITFPLPADLRAGDQIHEVYVNNQYVDIPFVLKYAFPNERKIYPYAKAGMLLSSAQKQKYTYEIIRNNDEIKTSTDAPSTPWIFSSFIAGLGADYHVSSRFSLGLDLEGRYNYRITSGASTRYHALGLRFNLHCYL